MSAPAVRLRNTLRRAAQWLRRELRAWSSAPPEVYSVTVEIPGRPSRRDLLLDICESRILPSGHLQLVDLSGHSHFYRMSEVVRCRARQDLLGRMDSWPSAEEARL